MALKSFQELLNVDVLPHCDVRVGKDENGRKIEIPYLNWAKCLCLLYEHGAENAYFEPMQENGSFLISCGETQNKDGRVCGSYFVKVRIHIDDMEFEQAQPLMNGSLVVYNDTLNQLRISNTHARAFVKGVAVRTGLGLKLWMKEDSTDTTDDPSLHDPLKVRQHIEELVTTKIKRGMTQDEILAGMGVNQKSFDATMRALNNAAYLIGNLKK